MLEVGSVAAQVTDLNISQVDKLLQQLTDMCIHAGKSILIALLIFIVGRFVIRLLNHVVARVLNRQAIDVTVQTFLKSLVNILLTILLIVSVISALGIETTSFAALLASAGVAIGMALSGNLQNFAGGLVILLFKPYKVGDFIEAQNVQGTVREIQIFHTILTMPDNKLVYLPNGMMSSSVIINYSRNETRRVEWVVGIDYGTDVETARQAIADVLDQKTGHEQPLPILSDPGRVISVQALADSSVNLVARVWVKPEDYWDVYHAVWERIYETFNQRGISFPFPQQTIHIVK